MAQLTFWQAVPIALLITWLAGIILGLPVLRMRGDYLAIVTLGFGEIVRLLVLSDWLKDYLGGTQGIQSIAQPVIGPMKFNSLQELYYLLLIGIAIVAFIAWRLKDSRLGRSWMAIREDEDVAQAMGINLVLTKLLAFSTGALFAGMAGTLGAPKLTSVYPHSMTFLVSINVLVLIIIGGMGSIPGVFVGALVLVGLPGILTEFDPPAARFDARPDMGQRGGAGPQSRYYVPGKCRVCHQRDFVVHVFARSARLHPAADTAGVDQRRGRLTYQTAPTDGHILHRRLRRLRHRLD